MNNLLIATFNEGKWREYQEMLSDLPFVFSTLHDISSVVPVAETAGTFFGNASLKASEYAKQTSMLTLADDSGLEVDALYGRPGVMSARYGGSNLSDQQRVEKLLAELRDISNRSARFKAAIALADPKGSVLNVSIGECEGRIAAEPRGSGGFGYDCVFIPAGFEMTFGELSLDIKNEISHRSAALKKMRLFLERLTLTSAAG